MTNAPFIVNIDCDMYVNNPNVVVEAMCILLGAEEQESIFVQFPQIFYNLPKDDPFGCQLITLFQVIFYLSLVLGLNFHILLSYLI